LAIQRSAVDMALVLVFVGYAVAILLFMRRGADALRLAPFDGADSAYRAILFTAFALLFSAAVDTFVVPDLAWANGEYAVTVVTGANLVALGIIAIAVASASRSQAPAEPADTRLTSESTDVGIQIENIDGDRHDSGDGKDDIKDATTFASVQTMMESRHVYRDVDLNLNRLARKLGIPTRQVSTAINRATGKNVSQYVNEFRISEACSLLTTTEKPVTEIMFEVGFQTKSNFNREFRRVTEMNPVEWRECRGRAA
jgi:AraC-like DNA-binding protein